MNWNDFCKSKISEVKKLHKQKTGVDCNLENPQTFTDKLEWLKIYDSTFLKTYCADKITMRDYVKSKITEDITVPILGVYNKFDDIDFSQLPKDFIIKTNHASHTNIIVKNSQFNKNDLKKKFDFWMTCDYSLYAYEMYYKNIPRKIYIEPLLSNECLKDYKFFCFNGEPKIMYIGDDGNYQNPTSDFFDMNFNHLDIIMRDPNSTITPSKPLNFEKMKQYAKILAQDFKFVRVDFYEINGKLYISELTFIPSAAYIHFKNPQHNLLLGEWLKL